MESGFYRGRRLRRSPGLRDLVRETRLGPADLIMPYIVADTDDQSFCREIVPMPGQFQFSLGRLQSRIGAAVEHGLRGLILFGVPKHKDEEGSEGWRDDGIVQRAVRMTKANWPNLLVITDVCLCAYTSHGHCRLLAVSVDIMHDPTVVLLFHIALSHARP